MACSQLHYAIKVIQENGIPYTYIPLRLAINSIETQ